MNLPSTTTTNSTTAATASSATTAPPVTPSTTAATAAAYPYGAYHPTAYATTGTYGYGAYQTGVTGYGWPYPYSYLQQHNQAAAAAAAAAASAAAQYSRTPGVPPPTTATATTLPTTQYHSAVTSTAAAQQASHRTSTFSTYASNYSRETYTGRGGKRQSNLRGLFTKELRSLMYGFGDDRNPSNDTVNVMEEILIEYIADVCQHATGPSRKNRLSVDDLRRALSKSADAKKLARMEELLFMQEDIKRARAQFDDNDHL